MNGPQRTACLGKLITNNNNQLTDLPGFPIVANRLFLRAGR